MPPPTPLPAVPVAHPLTLAQRPNGPTAQRPKRDLDRAIGHHVTIGHCQADGPGSMTICYS
ncbi:hypothetical protein [Streptomyces sp. NPDC094437]|uniref:hypothetical protein n=1 Tax=Streptomyces sp. NPDC094437 TaxID=3366060 RepID=UPI00380376AD